MSELTDDDLPGFFAALGLPGVIDVHVHFMPDNVLQKVWSYFDRAPGAEWPIVYRFDEPKRLEILRRIGVLRFSALNYPHKPGMAAWLNAWSRDFAARTGDAISSATFFPEPEAPVYVRAALDAGAQVFKSHVQVGGYDPRDPFLDGVWGALAEAGVPVVCHCASGPQPGTFTGPGPIGEVLARHPGLTLVVAHCGMPEYPAFLDLAERFRNVHLDTTMAFTDFTERRAPFPADQLPRLAELVDRIVLGSDFPNIPHPYAHQIAALARLGLGDDWLRAVLHGNPARLLRLR